MPVYVRYYTPLGSLLIRLFISTQRELIDAKILGGIYLSHPASQQYSYFICSKDLDVKQVVNFIRGMYHALDLSKTDRELYVLHSGSAHRQPSSAMAWNELIRTLRFQFHAAHEHIYTHTLQKDYHNVWIAGENEEEDIDPVILLANKEWDVF